MAHKDKILANLKAKHPKVQNTVIEFIADKLDAKVATEADVDTVVAAFEEGPITVADIALQVTKEADKRVTEALNKKKDPKTPDDKSQEKKDPVKPNNNPDDPLDKLLTAFQELSGRIEGIEKGKTKEAATSKLLEKAAAEKIPVQLLPAIETEDQIEAAIEAAKTGLVEIKKTLANDGFAQGTPPAGGGNQQVKPGDTKALDADIAGFVKTQLAAKGITQKTE